MKRVFTFSRLSKDEDIDRKNLLHSKKEIRGKAGDVSINFTFVKAEKVALLRYGI
jgi:hypothetical protein